jgi:hypothetical protein
MMKARKGRERRMGGRNSEIVTEEENEQRRNTYRKEKMK